MNYTGLLFLISSSLLWSLSQSTKQPTYACSYCDPGANYTANSLHQANLNLLLSNLSSNGANSTGFYNTTIGQNSNTIYGLFLCKGDITSEECDQCIKMDGGNITQFCPNEAVAIIWYDLCMLRYSNQFIFSTMQENPACLLENPNNVPNPAQFNQTMGDLMYGLVNQAALISSIHMWAAGDANFTSSSEKVYGLVQCIPDISQNDCYRCLARANVDIPTYGMNARQGGRLLMPSCNLRYELNDPFYESTAAPPAPSPPATSFAPPPPLNKTATEGKGKTSSTIIIITVVLAIIAVILVSVLYVCFCMRRKPKSEIDGVNEISMVQSLQFDFHTIRAATANFSDFNKLGQGGFGVVYKWIYGSRICIAWVLLRQVVFSFGVLLLEIVSGQKNNSFYQLEHTEDLLCYAWRNWREGTVLELIDTTLRGNCSISEVMRCIHIGLPCVQENVADRPTTASVDLMFNGSSIILPLPSSPAFFAYNRREADKSSSENDAQETEPVPSTTKSTPRSTNGTSISELYPC